MRPRRPIPRSGWASCAIWTCSPGCGLESPLPRPRPSCRRPPPPSMPRPDSVRVDAGVFLFTIAVAFLAASLAGLAPALSSARVDVVAHLRGGGRGVTPRAARAGRQALVVAQVMLAVVVVAAAALLSRTVLRLQTADMGFAADRLALVVLDLPQDKYGEDVRHPQVLGAPGARPGRGAR